MTKMNAKFCYKLVCRLFLSCVCFSMFSCVSVDPAKVDVTLKQSQPEVKLTSYTETLNELGLMTEIYATGELRIQSDPVGDNTGTSGSTGGEIPRDITEILKSTLNSIGGNVLYIPYDPAYIQNMNVTGYSNFEGKLIPEVVVSGGITEFDRGLTTRGDGTDIGAEASFTNAPSWTPANTVGFDYGNSGKEGTARITLDFNMLDFKTLAGIPRMNTVNSMEVHKALREKELGITLFGPTFGRKGSIKKVQGRHAAVRVLVEVSMIQMIGKYLVLPYWKLLGDDSDPDPVVTKQIKRYYYSLNDEERISTVQQWMFLYGNDLKFSGQLDNPTIIALQKLSPSFAVGSKTIDLDTFITIYTGIPIDERTLARRNLLNTQILVEQQSDSQDEVATASAPVQEQETASYKAPEASVAPTVSKQPDKSSQAAAAPTAQAKKRQKTTGIGRMISDEEW
ncbi:hypothetical protein [Desulfobacula phenolica]|uniref:Uncharacterized protein n=1 Tax=Desulfobacula phenolica TaxID=90732 RepID=A0A1H2HUI5_9BACT|nr:hypothetical protein [Desulfobacula phenolica]SDU35563.1 hypothetical protein SAMN04487931_10756 [Desulfobacula phenolica]